MNQTLKSCILAIIVALPSLLFALTSSVDTMIGLFPDDAFYYLQIAFNFVDVGRISFDGITATNGVQPFQFLVSSVNAFLVGKEGMLRLAIIENGLWVILTAWVAMHYLMKDLDRQQQRLGFVILAMPIWYLYVWLDAGMEMGPVLCFGTLFYCLWVNADKHGFRSTKSNCALTVAAVLLFLSRLDTAIALFPFFAVALYIVLRTKPGRNAVAFPIVIAACIIGPYLLMNLYVFGHWIPISGLVKSSSPVSTVNNWRGLSSGNILGAGVALAPLVVASASLAVTRTKSYRKNQLCLLIGVILYYVYLLFYAGQVFRWYMALPLVLQTVASAHLFGWLCKLSALGKQLARPWSLVAAISLTILSHSLLYQWAESLNTTTKHLKQVSDRLNELVTTDDIIATHDAGVIGYFSKARVINLDGLVNSLEYYEKYYRTKNFMEYLGKMQVNYFLVRKTLIQDSDESSSSNYTFTHDARMVFDENQLVEKFSIPGQFDLLLFRLHPSAIF